MTDLELVLAKIAGRILHVRVDISLDKVRPTLRDCFEVIVDSEYSMIKRMCEIRMTYGSLRAPGASETLYRAANDASMQLIDWNVISNGRLELLHYVREQSVSETTHRYGNIIPKPQDLLLKQSMS